MMKGASAVLPTVSSDTIGALNRISKADREVSGVGHCRLTVSAARAAPVIKVKSASDLMLGIWFPG
jgi:hypothetical protein